MFALILSQPNFFACVIACLFWTSRRPLLLHTKHPSSLHHITHNSSPKCSEEDVCALLTSMVRNCCGYADFPSHCADPQPSPEELREAEAEASYTVQQGVAAAVALYLCTCSTSIATYSRQLVPQPLTNRYRSAPFLIDVVWKLF